ncbi:amidohydrolase [Pseudoalteromonas tunicata]|uniref:amidohydrolase n=1 Tax=Pseudoalteromonas tunicata TaxID=314281 RepID=UPI00273D1DFD|nr:amidohydrolase [Pseudoalteromonas tunicata]MDP4983682.1 amidohydrolase [Pseudoalteromonas tunicata]
MKKTKQLLAMLLLSASSLALAGCLKNQPESTLIDETVAAESLADSVYINGAVYTVNAAQPSAQAIAVQGNKIVFVGTTEHVNQYIGKNTQVVDLQGRTLMPGFHDVHIHPLESASASTQFTLDEQQSDPEYFIADIANASANFANTPWLIGYGHTINTILNTTRSPLDILDEAESNRPVIIMEQTSHSMWVNSKALQLAQLNDDSADPIGGVLGRDQLGHLNGILYDNAGNLVMQQALAALGNSAQNEYLGLVEYTLPEFAKYGITSISDARSYWQRDQQKVWLRAEQEHKLTVRANLGLWAYPELSDEKQLKQLAALYQNDPTKLVKINQIKLYSDGILTNTTAAMHEPYQIDLLGLYGNKGLNYFSQERIAKYIKALEPIGFDFHMHGIGDRAISEALNAVEMASKGLARHRITHVEVVDPEDYKRFLTLNVTADAQVAGEFTNPEHWSENSELIGDERSDHLVPIKSLSDAGARLTLSSDWSVSHFNPFLGLHNALNRAPEAITLDQAIRAYTINGAYTMRQEQLVGSIEVGKLADFVVLDRDIRTTPISQIKKTKIDITVFDGEVIYQR